MANDQDPASLAVFQATLDRMVSDCLMYAVMWRTLRRVCTRRHSRPPTPIVAWYKIMPLNSGGMDVEVVAGLTWAERMNLNDELNDEPTNTTSEEHSGGDKVHLTQIQESTKDLLCKAFTPMNNAERRQLRQQFIIPDASFTVSPRLDKVMAAECSKSAKSAEQQLSRIQALFLDIIGPLSGLLENINKGTEVTLDDMEGAVKAALTFIGNASSQYTSLRRVGILEEYNKDLVSFSQESENLFSSATGTLFGPSFAEKAADHLKQLQTLRRAKGVNSKGSQGFSKAPLHYQVQRGASPTHFNAARVTSHTPKSCRKGDHNSHRDD